MIRALLFAALFAGPAAAVTEFSAERIKADVSYLADDLLEGRGTGQRGHELAARYVAAQFAIAGLKPGAKDGSWFQRVGLHERRLGNGPATVTLRGPGGSVRWRNGNEVVVGPHVFDARTDVDAQVVFAGYGLDAPAQGLDDYAGLDVGGKLVAVLDGVPEGPPNEVWAHLATTKAKMAAARGAIGIVQIQTLASAKRQPWARVLPYATVPRMTWVDAAGKPFTAAPESRASVALSGKAAARLFAGAPVAWEAVQAEAARPGGRPMGFALPSRLRVQATALYSTLTSPNVIGLLPGSDQARKAEYIVLMAHLDHLGIRPELQGDTVFNGALDNAAGIGVMIEVARAFAAGPPPKRSILFVALTAEEKGLLGAEGFANSPPVPADSIAAVVNLDQPMLLYDFTDIIAFGADHSTLGPAVARGAARAGVKLSPDPMPQETIFVRSDHYSFVKRGVPAVMLATGHANGGKAAWEKFLSTNYHQPSDDLAQPIVWAAAAKYARVNYEIARDLADAPARPRWYAGDFFGDRFAATAPKAARP